MHKELLTRILSIGTKINGQPPYAVADTLKELSRIAKRLNRIAEDDCNGNPVTVGECRDGKWYECTKQDQARTVRNERQWDRLVDQAVVACQLYGFTMETQRDPRGACLKVNVKGMDITNILYEI